MSTEAAVAQRLFGVVVFTEQSVLDDVGAHSAGVEHGAHAGVGCGVHHAAVLNGARPGRRSGG